MAANPKLDHKPTAQSIKVTSASAHRIISEGLLAFSKHLSGIDPVATASKRNTNVRKRRVEDVLPVPG